jgi:serine/threonine protein phosphatase 1
MEPMTDRRIARLPPAERIWAIAAVHSDVKRLRAVHNRLRDALRTGDRVVYLGNLIGWNPEVCTTLDELLAFRREVIARPGGFACDVVYLRGRQEVMWQKLLQLQFTPDPVRALEWMLPRGVQATLSAYGGDAQAGERAARAGTMALTRWTGKLRQAMKAQPGHVDLLGRLRSAAVSHEGELLFVNTGLDPAKPLDAQQDLFWWHGAGFNALDGTHGYNRFARVVRGFDPGQRGVTNERAKLSLDAGAGFGGPLVAACLDPAGRVVDRIEV